MDINHEIEILSKTINIDWPVYIVTFGVKMSFF